MHFFKSLLEHQWGKDGFELYVGSFIADPSEYFAVSKPSDGLYTISILRNMMLSGENPLAERKFIAVFSLLYDRKKQSKVTFKTPSFLVDQYGNSDATYTASFAGEMSKLRVGDLLPMDYSQ